MTVRKVDLSSMSVPRARKGEAAPVSHELERQSAQEADVQRVSEPSTVGPVASSVVAVSGDIRPRKASGRGEPRSPVTTRITYGLQDRLFRAATVLGKTQQQIIEDALDGYLRANML